MPVWPGATPVVHGDAPVAAGCATVVCRWRPGGAPVTSRWHDRVTINYKTRTKLGVRSFLFSLIVRGRPFDFLGGGGGGWVIFQKKFLSLVLQKKNNLSLKRLEKNNLSLKKVKKNNLAWPEKKIKKISWLTIKEKPQFYLIFVMCRWLLGAVAPIPPLYIKKLCICMPLVSFIYLMSIIYPPHLIYIYIIYMYYCNITCIS